MRPVRLDTRSSFVISTDQGRCLPAPLPFCRSARTPKRPSTSRMMASGNRPVGHIIRLHTAAKEEAGPCGHRNDDDSNAGERHQERRLDYRRVLVVKLIIVTGS